MPILLPHLVNGTVYDIYGNILEGITVTLTHSIPPVLSAITNSEGKYTINLSGLSEQWTAGETITLYSAKSGEGRKTEIATISTGGGTIVNITLEETSNMNYAPSAVEDRRNLELVMPVLFDGTKITRINRFPIQTENPLDKYQPSDQDVSSDSQYFGFIDRLGNWYIQQFSNSNGTFRYVKGTSNYTANWANRTNLDYDYFYNVF